MIKYLLNICNLKYNIIEFYTSNNNYNYVFINLGLKSKLDLNYDYVKYY